MWKRMLIAVVVMLLTGCNVQVVAPPATPTPLPSSTPLPTLTLTPTPAPSATATLEATVTAAPKASNKPELDCKILSQSIPNGSKFTPRERFDISWQIQNTGSATWEPGAVALVYAGGTRMFLSQPVKLPHSSPPGDIIGLSADMITPVERADYNMIWALRRGDEFFCQINVWVKVRRGD